MLIITVETSVAKMHAPAGTALRAQACGYGNRLVGDSCSKAMVDGIHATAGTDRRSATLRVEGTFRSPVDGVLRSRVESLLHDGVRFVVLDLSGVTDASDGVVECLARSILEAQRLGRSVTLVRCSDELFRRLQRTGLSGAVTHAASLLGATRGLARDTAGNVDLHLRSSAEMLPRLRSVTAAVARRSSRRVRCRRRFTPRKRAR